MARWRSPNLSPGEWDMPVAKRWSRGLVREGDQGRTGGQCGTVGTGRGVCSVETAVYGCTGLYCPSSCLRGDWRLEVTLHSIIDGVPWQGQHYGQEERPGLTVARRPTRIPQDTLLGGWLTWDLGKRQENPGAPSNGTTPARRSASESHKGARRAARCRPHA